MGSSKLVQLLLQQDMVDEFWLNIHPVVLGKGKKLFDDGAIPSAFELAESFITPKGVIMANYKNWLIRYQPFLAPIKPISCENIGVFQQKYLKDLFILLPPRLHNQPFRLHKTTLLSITH